MLFSEKRRGAVWRSNSHLMEMRGLQKSSTEDVSIKPCHGFIQMIFDWKNLVSLFISIKTLCEELASNFFERISKSPKTTKNNKL